ncbi:YheC/YheD family endospore coat-associated protein [Niallia nealsonii]|uniref:Glutathione synthetase n=1 Tax=Niallia nealsonii TaxID=115979 RepID=A0A2N0Z7D8_9BACI|nr:YheC/YheD family protein [Niallia nealsonii]PKG25428.1 glutathione synthetase [Niallia nealsonii]
MKKLYPIEYIPSPENTIFIPESCEVALPLHHVSFGIKKTAAIIKKQKNAKNIISISNDLKSILQLPDDSSNIHLFFDSDTLYLGPLVGIFTCGFHTGKVKPIGERSLIFSKLLSVQKTAGVIAFLFGEQHINWEKETINGLFYEKGQWEVAEIPFPNVIYDRIPNRKSENLPRIQRTKKRLQQEFLIPWYNPGFFNKLDIYERLLQENSISDYLPETHAFTSFSLVERMLSNFGHVYIKPKNGSLGKGIYQLLYDRKEEMYYIRFNDEKGEKRLQKFETLETLMNHTFSKVNMNNFIIQQGIHLIRFEQKPIDFRVHTNKNKNGVWEVTAIAAKIAGSGSVTTHLSKGGTIKAVEELTAISSDTEGMLQKLKNASLKISKALEKQINGIIGEIGFDIGIDRKGRVWLFEANSKPGRSIFKYPSLKKYDVLTRKLSLEHSIYLMEQNIKKLEGSTRGHLL